MHAFEFKENFLVFDLADPDLRDAVLQRFSVASWHSNFRYPLGTKVFMAVAHLSWLSV